MSTRSGYSRTIACPPGRKDERAHSTTIDALPLSIIERIIWFVGVVRKNKMWYANVNVAAQHALALGLVCKRWLEPSRMAGYEEINIIDQDHDPPDVAEELIESLGRTLATHPERLKHTRRLHVVMCNRESKPRRNPPIRTLTALDSILTLVGTFATGLIEYEHEDVPYTSPVAVTALSRRSIRSLTIAADCNDERNEDGLLDALLDGPTGKSLEHLDLMGYWPPGSALMSIANRGLPALRSLRLNQECSHDQLPDDLQYDLPYLRSIEGTGEMLAHFAAQSALAHQITDLDIHAVADEEADTIQAYTSLRDLRWESRMERRTLAILPSSIVWLFVNPDVDWRDLIGWLSSSGFRHKHPHLRMIEVWAHPEQPPLPMWEVCEQHGVQLIDDAPQRAHWCVSLSGPG